MRLIIFLLLCGSLHGQTYIMDGYDKKYNNLAKCEDVNYPNETPFFLVRELKNKGDIKVEWFIVVDTEQLKYKSRFAYITSYFQLSKSQLDSDQEQCYSDAKLKYPNIKQSCK